MLSEGPVLSLISLISKEDTANLISQKWNKAIRLVRGRARPRAEPRSP